MHITCLFQKTKIRYQYETFLQLFALVSFPSIFESYANAFYWKTLKMLIFPLVVSMLEYYLFSTFSDEKIANSKSVYVANWVCRNNYQVM